MKAYTDLEQSKKLAEILPLESADMYYPYDLDSCKVLNIPIVKDDYCIPCVHCWSLAALLSILDFPALTQEKEDEWEVCICDYDNDGYIEKIASNPVDACVELIIKLKEQNLL